MFIQPLGDSLVLAKLAFEIYRKGYQVAKHAPDEFRRLLEELRYSRDLFWWIHKTTAEDEHALLQDALARCMNVLEDEFRPLVKKFEKLSSTDRNIFFKRVQFAVDKKSIITCRKSLSDAKDHLSLALAAHTAHTAHSIRSRPSNLYPSRLPMNRLRAQNVSTSTKDENDSDNESAKSFVTAPSDDEDGEDDSEFEEEHEPIGSLPESCRSPFAQRLDSVDTRDFSQSASGKAGGPRASLPQSSSPQPWRGITIQNNESSTEEGLVTASNSSDTASLKASHRVSLAFYSYSGSARDLEFPFQIGAEEGFLSNQKTFTLRKRHLASNLMQRAFYGPTQLEETFEEEAKLPETQKAVDSWLLCAVWWYLKSRTIWDILAPEIAEAPVKRPLKYWHTTVSIYQCHIDLMKSDFILRRMVLAKLTIGESISEAQWKTIQDLSAGIAEEKLRRELNPNRLEENGLHDHNLGFAESFTQPVEDPRRTSDGRQIPQALDNLDPPEKWLAVEQEHAGYHRKEVLFRSFVNAEIGSKDIGRKSPSAPYLLILSSTPGSSDLTVSLINQRGTVSLSRSMVQEDLEDFDRELETDTVFPFEFPSQEVIIKFLSREDVDKFFERPRKFFAATADRNPKSGEFLVFRDSLDVLDDIKPDVFQNQIMRSEKARKSSDNATVPRRSWAHCEVSLYEMVPDDCWKTTRRLVICSSPHEPEPWCVSFWMPLADVSVDLAEQHVKLTWSDFKNHEKKPSGDFWHIHSFTYQPKSPNREVWLTFNSSNVAEAFASCILNPFHTPFEMQEYVLKVDEFESPSGDREIVLYQMCNLSDEELGYHAVVTIDKRVHAQFHSQVFFVFRDLDFNLETEAAVRVEITNLVVPHYISNMTELNEFPAAEEGGPDLKQVRRLTRASVFEFEQVEELEDFMKIFTRWYLQLHCQAKTLSINYGIFDSKTLKDIAISVWEKPFDAQEDPENTSLQVTARSTHGNGIVWTTMKIDRNCGIDKNQGRDITVGKIDVQCGTKVDCYDMEASTPSKHQQQDSRKGKVSISFEDESCARQFVQLVNRSFVDWIPSTDPPAKKRGQLGSSSTNWLPHRTGTSEAQIPSSGLVQSRRRNTAESYDRPPDWPPPSRRRATQDSTLDPPPEWQPRRRATQDSFESETSEWLPTRRVTQDSFSGAPPEWRPASRRRPTRSSIDSIDPASTRRRGTKANLESMEFPPSRRRGIQESVSAMPHARRVSSQGSSDSSARFSPLGQRRTNTSFDGSLPPMYEYE